MILENNATFTQMYVFYSNPSQNFYILKDCMEVISVILTELQPTIQRYNNKTFKILSNACFVLFFVFSKML